MAEEQERELSIEEKYTQMSDVEHILARPGVYIGNIHADVVKYNLYKPSDNMVVRTEGVGYNAGLLKLFDEIITNPIDERRRKTKLFSITQIKVIVNRNGYVNIWDNGGIPVVMHGITKLWLPTMIFGHLKTSSNYTSDRDGAGTNGLGAKLTNIYSKHFSVITCDGKQQIETVWQSNMREHIKEEVKPSKEHYTSVSFDIDLARFAVSELDMSTIRIMQKRCIDACAANPGLEIVFQTDAGDGKLNQTFKFNSFKDFVRMHLTEEEKTQCLEWNGLNGDSVVLLPNIGYDFGFVNGAVCSAGSHMKKVNKKITERFLEIFKKKDMELISETDIKNNISIFVNTAVKNPDYDAQTKTNLTNPIPSDILHLPKQWLESLENSVIVTNMVEFYQIKYAAEQKKQLRQLNLAIKKTKSKKFTPCSNRVNKELNSLFLFEGTSAANGFAMYGDPQTMAAYELRGKILNVMNMSKVQVVENTELRELISILNLQFNDAQNNVKNCMYHKVIFGTDMDHDGDHIVGLFIVFFAIFFPELFIKGFIYRLISPIVIASKGDPEKGGQEKYYYSFDDYKKDELILKGWDIAYKKGLGSLENHHYEEMLNNQRLIQLKLKDKNYLDTVRTWFDKSTAQRKEILMDMGDAGISEEEGDE